MNRWCRHGVFGDHDRWAPGRGGGVTFSDPEIEHAWVCARLTELGAEMSVLTPVVARLREWADQADEAVLLVFSDGTALIWRREVPVPPEACWCVPLMSVSEIVAERQTRTVVETTIDNG